MLAHKAGHHHVHLAATVGQIIDFLPSTMRHTRVSRPTQCTVGPSVKSEEVQPWLLHVQLLLWQVFWGRCLVIPDLPLWSLNATYAMLGRFHGEGSPLQNDPLCHTQSTYAPPTDNGSWLGSFACLIPLFGGESRALGSGRNSSLSSRVTTLPEEAGYLLNLSL